MAKQTKRSKPLVWVVMHYEFLPNGHMDCLQFHVSSSLAAAKKYISKLYVADYSWWQVHPHVLDHNDFHEDEGEEIYYFSHKGKSLKAPPHEKAKKAWERARK